MTERQIVPEGAVVISPTQMYEEMRNIRDEVKHLASVVDPALNEVRKDILDARQLAIEYRAERKTEIASLKESHEDLRSRIEGLDKKVYAIFAIAVVLSTVGGWLLTFITK